MAVHYSADLTGQVALVTGAGQRLGRAIAEHLHHSGADVIVHYRHSAKAAQDLANTLNQQRPNSATAIAADLQNDKQRQALAEQTLQWRGQLNILVNNASSFYATAADALQPELFDDLIGSNLRAPALLSSALAPALRQSKGCIINMIDIHHQRPMRGFSAYSAAKAGLAGLTRSLALELAPDVRVNGIAPGAILWPEGESADHQANILQKIPLERCGTPSDIAHTALFLCSAAYISGQIIAVDGGRSLNM